MRQHENNKEVKAQNHHPQWIFSNNGKTGTYEHQGVDNKAASDPAGTPATSDIVRINPGAGKVIETYQVPDQDVSWNGLVFDDESNIYLLGTNQAGKGLIVRVADPV